MNKTALFIAALFILSVFSVVPAHATYEHTYDSEDQAEHGNYDNWKNNEWKENKGPIMSKLTEQPRERPKKEYDNPRIERRCERLENRPWILERRPRAMRFYERHCMPDEPDEPDLTCEDALAQGLITTKLIDHGDHYGIIVYNSANQAFVVSGASYQMYAAYVEDQTLYDSKTIEVPANGAEDMRVKVPACGWQLDVVCGKPLENNPEYGNRVIAHDFGNQDNYCAHEDTGNVHVSVAPFYPQGNQYVFECNTDFAATSYNWYFGDGNHWLSVDGATDNVFYTYNPGEYTVACSANDGTTYGAGTLDITVA